MAVTMAILGVRYALDQLSEVYISEKGGDFVDQVIRKPGFLKLMKNANPAVSLSICISSAVIPNGCSLALYKKVL